MRLCLSEMHYTHSAFLLILHYVYVLHFFFPQNLHRISLTIHSTIQFKISNILFILDENSKITY